MKKALIILAVLIVLAGLVFGLLYFFWTPENLSSLGARAMEKENYSRAVFFYEKAAGLDPTNPDYAISLADANIADGSYTQAERAIVSAIREQPAAALYIKLSSVYVAQDKLLDAQSMLDGITDASIASELSSLRPAAPTFSHPAGEYGEYIPLELQAEDGAVYCSTTDEYPSLANGECTEPLTLPAGTTHISAITVAENGLVSPLVEAEYLIVGVIEEITFESAELEAYIRDTLYISRTEPVMSDRLWEITELTVPEDVTTYSDLRHFSRLTSLTITNSSAEDYSFLQGTPALETLDLSGSLVSAETLDYIGTLTELTVLNLSACGISNVTALSGLDRLEVLDLSDNSISDISALADCDALERLNLQSNALISLASLEGCDNLTDLNVSQNNITSLAPLADSTALRSLVIDHNSVSDLSVLRSMTGLVTFTASNNSIADISPLTACTQLTRLILSYNQITDVEPIAAMRALAYLDISHNQVATLPALDPEAQLQQFFASYNLLEDISPLAGLRELTYVDVDYNEAVEDIECLSTCNLLVQVNAFGTEVSEVAVLTTMGVIVNYSPTED